MLNTYRERNISAVHTPKPSIIKIKPRSRSERRLVDRISQSLEQSKLMSNKIEKNVKFQKTTSKSINYDDNSRSRSLSREKEIEKFLDNMTSDDDGFEEIFNSSSEFETKTYDRKRLSVLNIDYIEKNDYIHDEETKEVLQVKFPPWMTSTHVSQLSYF